MIAEEWLKPYMTLCDNKDVDGIMEHWSDDAKLTFAKGETIVGKEALREWFTEFMDSLHHQIHKLGRVWELPDGTVFFEAEVDNIRHDGRELTVQGLTYCRIEGEQFLENRTYVDIAPVFAETPPAT